MKAARISSHAVHPLSVGVMAIDAMLMANQNARAARPDSAREADFRDSAIGGKTSIEFRNFIRHVANARDGAVHHSLQRAPTGAGEVDPTGGGFLVPSGWADAVVPSLYEAAAIAPLTTLTQTENPGRDLQVPAIDETSRAEGSRWGGVSSAWAAEGTRLSASRPTWRSVKFKTNKLLAGVWVTNELLADAGVLDAHMRRVLAAEFSFKLDQAIFSGSGAGQPLGLLNSPAKITVPKDTGQAAATIVQDNISNMWSRLPAPCRQRAVWLVHETTETQLDALAIGGGGAAGTMGAAPYIAAGAVGNETALLKGRPVIVVEQAMPLGTEGDIVLTDLSQYWTLQGTPRYALSAHFGFDTDQSMVRFTLRTDGRCIWSGQVTPYSGSSTRSPIVTLASR